MKKAKTIIMLCAIMTLVVLAGCSNATTAKKEDGRSELKIAYAAQPGTLDPHIATTKAINDIMMPVYETLITVDSKLNPQPMLAESFEVSNDGKTVTFYLREDVLFHNGKEMTSEDVVASMNRWKDGFGGKGQFTDSIFEVKDKYTVVLNNSKPLSTALALMSQTAAAFPAIMPKEIIDKADKAGELQIKEHVGTGPFKFTKWKQDQYIHLTKFDDYKARSEATDGFSGKKEALVDDLFFTIVPDSSTRIAGLQSGEYDVAHLVPYDEVDRLNADPSIESHIYTAGTFQITFNKKKGIFADQKAREAVATGLNIEELMTAAYTDKSFYTLTHNLMQSNQEEQWYSDVGKDKYNQNDLNKAKNLLDRTDYKGEELTMVSTRDYMDVYQGSLVLQEQLNKLGIKVNLEIYDWATLLEKFTDENAFDLFIMNFGTVPEPTSFLNLVPKSYESGWATGHEEMIEELRQQPSYEKAQDSYDRLQSWYYEEVPFIKLGDMKEVASVRSTVENFSVQGSMITWNVSNKK